MENDQLNIYFRFLIYGMLILTINFLVSGVPLLIEVEEIRYCFLTRCVYNEEIMKKNFDRGVVTRILVIVNIIIIQIFKMLFLKMLKKIEMN